MKNLSGWSRLFIVMNAIWAALATTVLVLAVLYEEPPDYIEFLMIYIISFVVPISLWVLIRSVAWVIEGFRSKDKD